MIDEIIEYLKIQYNGANSELKEKIKTILLGCIVERCKCPECGCKFDPRENIKYAKKIL